MLDTENEAIYFGHKVRLAWVTEDGRVTDKRVEPDPRLEDAYRTIRALVGEPSESCVSLDCPYERIVKEAIVRRAWS